LLSVRSFCKRHVIGLGAGGTGSVNPGTLLAAGILLESAMIFWPAVSTQSIHSSAAAGCLALP